jgi:hypothetical protein
VPASGRLASRKRNSTWGSRVRAWQRRALDGLDPDDVLAVRLRLRLTAEADYAAGTAEAVLQQLEHARRRNDPIVSRRR